VGKISEAQVEETWREVGALSETQARSQMDQIAKSQPSLLAFILGATGDLRTDAQQATVYLYAVIHRMFEKTAGRLTPATPKGIAAAYEGNQAYVAKFQHAHERFLEKAAESVTSPQPFVMKYLVEALMETPEGEEPLVLSDEEIGQIFLVLKTVIDVLDAGVPLDS
jgi:hypothetical protein